MKPIAIQGDLDFFEVDRIPKKAVKVGKKVIKVGETTGHKHQLLKEVNIYELDGAKYFSLPFETLVTHEDHVSTPLRTETGTVKVIDEVEYDPFEKAMRMVVD